MGWFWNKNNQQNQQKSQNIQNPRFSSSSSSSFSYSSKKRSCQNDPNDKNYIICKTIIKDNNGTRQEEQRIPKDTTSFSKFNENSQFQQRSNQSYLDNQNGQNIFESLPSFFIQPSFFDFHNSGSKKHKNQLQEYQNQKGNHVQRYLNQYSQSKKCYPDPENDQYLICKSKVFDGNQTKQIQERINAKSHGLFGFSPFFSGNQFSTYGNQVDKEIQNMMKDINEGFGFMMPIIGSMVNLAMAFNPQNDYHKMKTMGQQGQSSRNHSKYTQYNRPHSQKTNNYFTNTGAKDTNIYDL